MILATSLLVDVLREDPAARDAVLEQEEAGELLWIPMPAVFELYEGIALSDRPEPERSRVHAFLADYTVMDFRPAHARRAGELSGRLTRRGEMLDPIDVQIAGTALAEGAPVLTRDVDDFERVPELTVESY